MFDSVVYDVAKQSKSSQTHAECHSWSTEGTNEEFLFRKSQFDSFLIIQLHQINPSIA